LSKFDNRPKRDVEQGKNIFFTSPESSDKGEEKKESADVDYDETVRQTFYITKQQIKAISLMSAHEDMDKSEIVRAALAAYIPANYIRMVYLK
jgi:hypothetical protein